MSKKINLLIVDDDESVIQMYQLVMKKFLKKYQEDKPGVEVVIHYESCGEDAVAKFESLTADNQKVVGGFFDMKMPPGIDGYETIKRIEQQCEGLSFCVVTAHHDRTWSDFEELFGDQFESRFKYFQKPFNMKQILEETQKLVEKALHD